MNRWAVALAVAGVVVVVLLTRLGTAAMGSYLANWLFWSSLPLGALPVVMLLDLAGPGAGFGLEPALRRLLWLTPVAALLLVPVLLRPDGLFGWADGHGFTTPFGAAWMTPDQVILRAVVYFVLWLVLALLFVQPPSLAGIERRRGFAAIGLFVYAVTATLASVDWAMTVEPNWLSAAFGLLFMVSQAAVAISTALLLAGPAWRMVRPRTASAFLVIVAAAWLFMQFIPFLVIWSADKPSDIGWYLHRAGWGSVVAMWLAVLAGVVVPLCMLMTPRSRRDPRVLPAMAVLVLCAQAIGMWWLVTPSLRGSFQVSVFDVVALAGLGGVMVGLCLSSSVAPLKVGGPGHG